MINMIKRIGLVLVLSFCLFNCFCQPDNGIYQNEDSSSIWKLSGNNILFTESFLSNPTILINSDSIIFRIDTDTSINAEEVRTKDTSYLWVNYKDHGIQNFWDIYLEKRDSPSCHPFPIKCIKQYFYEKKIEAETYMYSPYFFVFKSHPEIWDKCAGCYNGTDYLFKIKKTDFIKIMDVSIMYGFRNLKINM